MGGIQTFATCLIWVGFLIVASRCFFLLLFSVLQRIGDCSNDNSVVPFLLLQIHRTLKTWGGFAFQ